MAARDHFRAHERRRVDFPATLRVHDGSPARGPGQSPEPPGVAPALNRGREPSGLRQDVRVRDLGLGGAGIEIPELSAGERAASPIDREVPVTIELLAPSLWDPLILRGKIAWIKRSGQGRSMRAGVRFEHREPAALYALFQFLGAHVHDA